MTGFTTSKTEQLMAADQRADLAIPVADRLQAARRLDWRFLLPDPRLGDVACLAPADEPLLAALRLFSHSVELVKPNGGPPGEYDLVVSGNFNKQQLATAARLVRPGGFIYGEAPGVTAGIWSRIRGLDWRPGPSSYPPDLMALAATLGLTSLHTYWHWPDFVNTSQIIPLDSDATLQLALARVGQAGRGRLKLAGGSLLLKSGLLRRLIPCFSLVAQRPTADGTR